MYPSFDLEPAHLTSYQRERMARQWRRRSAGRAEAAAAGSGPAATARPGLPRTPRSRRTATA